MKEMASGLDEKMLGLNEKIEEKRMLAERKRSVRAHCVCFVYLPKRLGSLIFIPVEKMRWRTCLLE
jgi:hypothetical protein